MKTLRKIFAIAACLAATVQVAAAADAPQIVEIDHIAPGPAGGWYLRGDIGYVIATDPKATYGGTAVNFVNEALKPTWMIGAGVGYQFNPWFRADLTVDYRFASKFTGNTVCGGCCLSVERQKLSTTTFLVNAYVDIATWQGFTPYVGVGAGVAYHWLHDLIGFNPGGGVTIVPDGGTWTWAAAAMTGVSFPVGENMLIDAGYRYLWLGNAKSGADGIGNRVEYSGLSNHELRIGGRRTF